MLDLAVEYINDLQQQVKVRAVIFKVLLYLDPFGSPNNFSDPVLSDPDQTLSANRAACTCSSQHQL